MMQINETTTDIYHNLDHCSTLLRNNGNKPYSFHDWNFFLEQRDHIEGGHGKR